MNRGWSGTLAVVTAVLNWGAFYGLARLFRVEEPFFLATILILSIVIHEIIHLIFLEAKGIKSTLIFLVVMGGAVPHRSHQHKILSLPWSTLAAIYLSGVCGNYLVILGASILLLFGRLTTHHFEQIVNLNALLVMYNLWPVWKLDGGHFAKLLFNSISEDRDMNYAISLGLTVGLVAITMTIISPTNFIITAWFVTWGLFFRATHDDPTGSTKHLAMTRRQQKRWAILYVSLICASIVLMGVTEPWYR